MKNMDRREFIKYSGTGLAGLTMALHFPFLATRKAYATVGANSFTIAVISDTQNYTDYGYQATTPPNRTYFTAQTQYLVNNKDDMRLAFVTHVGDVVQHGDGTNGTPGNASYGAGAEWDNAVLAMDILATSGVPFGLSIGNHDYDNYSWTAANGNHPLKSNVMWKRYFGSGSYYFANKPWYGGASDNLAINPGISSYQIFCAGGKKFLHISLEMEAGPSALAWAQGVINAHLGYATIVTTHDYLSPPATSDSNAPYAVPATRNAASTSYLKYSPTGVAATGTEWNDAQGVWDKFIKVNDQIFMVLCGHSWGSTSNGVSKAENIRIDNNVAGHPVYQILSDYQGNTKAGSKGGDGWLRFMEFDMDTNSIHCYTYSTLTNQKAGQNGETTFNQNPLFSDFSLVMPAQVLNAVPQFSAVSSGFTYSRVTKLYSGNLTVTNNGADFGGTLGVALNDLTGGVVLTNALGQYKGASYVTVSASGLAAGASASIPLTFSNPSNARINFNPVTFQE
jgi:hypothetical protein